MVSVSGLLSISPIDGRYASITEPLSAYFSESALMRHRVWVEVEYFIALCSYPLPALSDFPKEKYSLLRSLYTKWDLKAAERIKAIEQTTNHDVKAIEYYIKAAFEELGLQAYEEYVHFGLTSQDINNTAIPLMLKTFITDAYIPHIKEILVYIKQQSYTWKDVVMLARTHGQPASPTHLGKEIEVFTKRIDEQLTYLHTIPHCAKFGGATGNFNAHYLAYPHIDWHAFARRFVEDVLTLQRSHPTTQIEHYDHLASLLDNVKRINIILMDYCKDIWQYVAMNYFTQRAEKEETGSSTMPHKVNPIDFENAEGNLGLSNALLLHLSSKLPISRLQRDLTDSTTLRTLGVPLAHAWIAFTSIKKGAKKLSVNKNVINQDLDRHWTVITEGIQTILRREGYPKPYETVKDLVRGQVSFGKERLHTFIKTLNVSKEVKKELLDITPFNYTGRIN